MKQIKIDVMVNGGGKFYKTLRYRYNPLFKFDYDEMYDWVTRQLPSIKSRNDVQLVLY